MRLSDICLLLRWLVLIVSSGEIRMVPPSGVVDIRVWIILGVLVLVCTWICGLVVEVTAVVHKRYLI